MTGPCTVTCESISVSGVKWLLYIPAFGNIEPITREVSCLHIGGDSGLLKNLASF